MKRSLSRQITICSVSAIILCCCIFSVFSIRRIINSSTAQMKVDGKTLIRLIRREIASHSSDEPDKLQLLLKDIVLGSEGDLEYISISDENQNVLLSSGQAYDEGKIGDSSRDDSYELNFDREETVSFIYREKSGHKVCNLSTPITMGQEQYILSIGISLDSLMGELHHSVLLEIGISMIVTMICSAICIYLSRKMTRSIAEIQKGLEQIEKNDLTGSVQVSNKNELGQVAQAMNQMKDHLLEIIKITIVTSGEMSRGAATLSNETEQAVKASREVSGAVQEISCIIENQDKDINNIYGELDFINAKLEEAMICTTQVVEHNSSISQLAEDSFMKLENLTEAIYHIKNLFYGVLNKMEILNHSIDQINEMTSIINNVAEQTNLLSLNAAIEAARAGEAGRGFAVVAGEIRKLSEQVKSSSDHINTAVSEVKGNMNEVIRGNEQITVKMKEQSVTIDETINNYRSLEKFNVENEKHTMILNAIITEIVADKEELLTQVEQLKDMSANITSSTQEITSSIIGQADNIENINQFTSYLREEAAKLEENVIHFKI